MSVVQKFETSGELLAPPVRATTLLVERQKQLRREQDRLLTATVSHLQTRVRERETRRGLDSTDSSKPPSSNPTAVRSPGENPSGKKRRRQKGHPRAFRSLLPPARIDELIKHHPLPPLWRLAVARGGRRHAAAPSTVELPPT